MNRYLRPIEVPQGSLHPLSILYITKGSITTYTEQSPDLTRLMVMIYGQLWIPFFTDGTTTVKFLIPAVVLPGGNPIGNLFMTVRVTLFTPCLTTIGFVLSPTEQLEILDPTATTAKLTPH